MTVVFGGTDHFQLQIKPLIQPDNDETRAAAAKIIAGGGVVAFLTDTFYGLGADPLSASAVARIRKLKGREDSKPILVLVSDPGEVPRLIADSSELFREVATKYWPAPLTLIGPARNELPQDLTSGTNTLGVRLPDDDRVRSFVRSCGGALTATSANLSGRADARTANEVEDYFGNQIDLIVDGGTATATQPSTVLDLTTDQPRVIREGALSAQALSEIL